jgi:hypothetical protein
MKPKYIYIALLSVCLTFIAGCGGGGDSTPAATQPTLVTLKLTTTGTLPVATAIGGIAVTITANPSTGLTIADADVSATGVATGLLLSPTTSNVAAVVVAFADATGIPVGEFATVKYHIAAGTIPVAGNFTVSLNEVIKDANTPVQTLPGIDVSIQSISIQ